MFKTLREWLGEGDNAEQIDAIVFYMKGGGSHARKKRYEKYANVYLHGKMPKRSWFKKLWRFLTFRGNKKT